MQKKYLYGLGASAVLLSSHLLGAENESKPNVVIIYGDDVGFGDVGVYGSKMIPTPNLDKFASESLVFTDGHCSASTCTPSRFSMLTGVNAFRNGVNVLPPNAPLCVPTDVMTLPKLFKKAGYDTAVIGKWHLGLGKKGTPVDWNGEVKPGPIEVGFDYSFLLPSTNDRVPCVYLENYKVVNLDPADPLFVSRKEPEGFSGTVYPDGRKNRDAMTYYESSRGHNNSVINGIGRIGYMWGGKAALWNDETMADEFIKQTKKYIGSKKDKPFFLYFASQDIHVPRTPHPRFKGKSKLTYRGDAMVQLDWTAGEILKALEENGLREKTIVIFSSDNGPVYDDGYKDGTTVRTSSQPSDRGHFGAGPYRGGKYQIYEGGTRVPFIIGWPGKIKPGKSKALVNQIDFIASFASLLNIKLSKDEARDSRNIIDALLGKDAKGLPYMVEERRRTLALRKGAWKYINGGASKSRKKGKKTKVANTSKKGQLYNLEKDEGEKTNVIDQHPEIASEMQKILQKIRDENRTRE